MHPFVSHRQSGFTSAPSCADSVERYAMKTSTQMRSDARSLVAVSVGLIALAGTAARAQILITNSGTDTVGVYYFNGSVVNAALISGLKKMLRRIAVLVATASWLVVGHAQTQILFVSDATAGTVSKVSSSGTVSTFVTGLNRPFGVAVDSGGNLFVMNQGNGTNGTISKVSPAGSVSTFATGIVSGEGLVFDASDNLYVANNGSVTKFTPGGSASQFATGFNTPAGLTFDSNGNLFVTAYGSGSSNGSIWKVTPGSVITLFSGSTLNGPLGISVAPNGNFYVAIYNTGFLTEFFSGGGLDTLTGVSYPYGTAVNADGDVFVSDHAGNIRKLFSVDTGDGINWGTTVFATGLIEPTYMTFATVTAVPEPETCALCFGACGLFVAGVLRRKRSERTGSRRETRIAHHGRSPIRVSRYDPFPIP
jgi:streptogramin lyase